GIRALYGASVDDSVARQEVLNRLKVIRREQRETCALETTRRRAERRRTVERLDRELRLEPGEAEEREAEDRQNEDEHGHAHQDEAAPIVRNLVQGRAH